MLSVYVILIEYCIIERGKGKDLSKNKRIYVISGKWLRGGAERSEGGGPHLARDLQYNIHANAFSWVHNANILAKPLTGLI